MPQPITPPQGVLAHAFSTHGARAALDRYATFAGGAGWSIDHKVRLYAAGLRAVEAARPEAERRASFRVIYESLVSYWQVFRPKGAARCWTPDQIYDALVASDSPLTRGSGLRASDARHGSRTVVAALQRLRGLKPGEHYPTMAVSKFAHFANPRLVPIYDQAVVWNVAFAEFRPAFDRYCRSVLLDLEAWGAEFLEAYIAWSGALVTGDPGVLPVFAAWARERVPDMPPEVVAEIESYEAAAFEMILIGAAHLARDRRR